MEMAFHEQVSLYLNKLMKKVEKEHGIGSKEYKALYYQYIATEHEDAVALEKNLKHYEAVVDEHNIGLQFVERLYKRQATVDMTLACNAHCRYCLRQNYSKAVFDDKAENEVVQYFEKDSYLKEVLITGGDPLLCSNRLVHLISRIAKNAPNIKVIRIGTRLPVQNPLALDEKLLQLFYQYRNVLQIEIAMQINHLIEYQAETESCVKALQEVGARIYAQNVFLKNVNDDIESLIQLYDNLRYQGVESHYIFHPVPIKGTSHFRMPIETFLRFARELTSSGEIPGRSKPMFSVMTDIGKVTLYQGVLGVKDADGFYTLNTDYSLEQRKKWNPNYILPDTAKVDGNGKMFVKYLDGKD